MSHHKDIQTSSENVISGESTTPASLLPTSEEGLLFFQQQAAAAKGMMAAERSDAAVSDLPMLIFPSDRARGSAGEDTKLTARELGRLMQPRDANSPFKGFQDLSAITAGGDTVPISRRASGLYTNNEDAWLSEVDRSIYDWLNVLKKDGRIEIVTDGLDARDKSKMAHRQ